MQNSQKKKKNYKSTISTQNTTSMYIIFIKKVLMFEKLFRLNLTLKILCT